MIKLGVVGLGKMGMSHLSIANANPETDVVACDASRYVVDALKRYSKLPVYDDYHKMLDKECLDAVIIATPSHLHAPMVESAMQRDIHVFCEKPFCLDWNKSVYLAALAGQKKLTTQVGYHYRFVASFQEMKRVVESGALGTITHALAEAYGPVVLHARGSTWRTKRREGGGCLYDYAAHPINLLNWFFGEPAGVSGTILASIFSSEIDDEVYTTISWDKGLSAHVSVNWSDESYRKMSTKITLKGTNGSVYADRQECRLYLRTPCSGLPQYGAGWNVRYTTELTQTVDFYLRGEEYTTQINDFVQAVNNGTHATTNDFACSAETDKTIAMMIADRDAAPTRSRTTPVAGPKKRSFFNYG